MTKEAESNRMAVTSDLSMDWTARDEMNLAEFPLAAVSDRIPRGVKTFRFEDRIIDRSKNDWITRRVTITGSDRYGLPTSVDDEVVLGLIQLSKESGFRNPLVCFSRYQLIRLLGWRDDGKSYRRLTESLNRWLGVTLYYENAWWRNDLKSWVDESFHILEKVSIVKGRPRKSGHDRQSSFIWNDVVFQSFKSGWIKPFNMKLFRELRTPTAKRMLRFLDKRFHRTSTFEMDLRQFAEEHVGVQRGYDTGELKRRINPAIRELVEIKFLRETEAGQTYRRVRHGHWRIILGRGPAARRTESIQQLSPLERQLVNRGVSQRQSVTIARDHDADTILRQIEAFDAMVARKDVRINRNPAGFLVKAIRDDYELPAPTPNRRHARKASSTPPIRLPDFQQDCRVDVELSQFLKSLSVMERYEFESQALASADAMQLNGLRRAESEGNTRAVEGYRQAIVRSHFRNTHVS